MLQLTISNLTGHPITALVPFVSIQEQEHNPRKWLRRRACRETSEVVLRPQLERSATFPCKEVTLRSSRDGQGLANSDFRISISMPPKAIWRCVFVPEDCPWRIYIMKVRHVKNPDFANIELLMKYLLRSVASIVG